MDYGLQINLLHSLLIGPFLVWTGYKLNTNQSLSGLEKLVMLIIGMSVIVFHGWKAVQHQLAGDSILSNYGFQINMLHFLFIGPLIAWVGYKLYKDKSPTDLEKTTLLVLGIIALVYHAFNAFKKYNSQQP